MGGTGANPSVSIIARIMANYHPSSKGATMQTETVTATNVKQVVPFFSIASMEASLRYYIDGLGFTMTKQWIPEGKIRWCWLELGGAAIMLQEYREDRRPTGNLGAGVSICFQCEDALAIYREAKSHGITVQTPFVGNNMWVANMTDPDGYSLSFQSPTEAPEETILNETAN
jgi:lactoylglutathione lyase